MKPPEKTEGVESHPVFECAGSIIAEHLTEDPAKGLIYGVLGHHAAALIAHQIGPAISELCGEVNLSFQINHARAYGVQDLLYSNIASVRCFSPGGLKWRNIRLQVRDDLEKDFWDNGFLHCQFAAKAAIDCAARQLDSCGLGTRDDRLAAPGNNLINSIGNAWNGEPSPGALKVLRQHGQLRISCPSIYPAPILVLKSLIYRLHLELVLDSCSPHSPAQFKALESCPADFFFGVDSPFFLSSESVLKDYKQILVCNKKAQHLLTPSRRRRNIHKWPPHKCYFLNASSAEAEYHRTYGGTRSRVKGEYLWGSKDFGFIAKDLDDGDCLYAHEPLASRLKAKYGLISCAKKEEFWRYVCLFAKSDLAGATNRVAESFAEVFVAEWNYCLKHPGWCKLLLLGDYPFLLNRSIATALPHSGNVKLSQ